MPASWQLAAKSVRTVRDIRFLADEDLRAGIVQGLRVREPAVDILDVRTAGLRGLKDVELLELAAQQGRSIITHDRQTMTRYFRARLDSDQSTPGLFVVAQQPGAIGEIIEWLLLVWTATQAEEWQDRIVYVPAR